MVVINLCTFYNVLKTYDPNLCYWNSGDKAPVSPNSDFDEQNNEIIDKLFEDISIEPLGLSQPTPIQTSAPAFLSTSEQTDVLTKSQLDPLDQFFDNMPFQTPTFSDTPTISTEKTLENITSILQTPPASPLTTTSDISEDLFDDGSFENSTNSWDFLPTLDTMDIEFDDLYKHLTSVDTSEIFHNTSLENSIEKTNFENLKQQTTDRLRKLKSKRKKVIAGKKHLQKNIGRCRKVRNHPNNCYHLWDFIRDLLDDPKSTCAVWIDKSQGEFRITNTSELSLKWGQLKKSNNMTYDKLSRSLRYYCSLNVLEKVPGTRLQFRFGKRRTWTKEEVS